MQYVSWISKELRTHYPGADFKKGVDLNRNGRLERNELIRDSNRNGVVGDHADWVAFYGKNSAALRKLGGIFTWGQSLKPDNPLHDIICIGNIWSTSNGKQRNAYASVGKIVQLVRKRLFTRNSHSHRKWTPQEKMKLVYSAIRSLGIGITANEKSSDVLLVDAIKNKQLNQNTSSYIVLAVAHEMGWPVHLVEAPGNVFVRWEGSDGTKFNIDNGEMTPDAEYIQVARISKRAIDNGVYLKNCRRNELLSHAFTSRGVQVFKSIGRSRQETLAAAIACFDMAVSLNSKNAQAYYERGAVKYWQKKYVAAAKDFSESLVQAPNNHRALYGRGKAHFKLDMDERAVADLDMAISIKPRADYYYIRGRAKARLGRYKGAISDFSKALGYRTAKKWTYLYYRGKAKADSGKYAEAIKDFESIIARFPDRSEIFIELGRAYAGLRQYAEAMLHFKKAIELNPPKGILAQAYVYRGVVLQTMKKFARAREDFKTATSVDPTNGKIHLILAAHCARNGKAVMAIRHYNKAILLGENSPHVYYECGKQWMVLRDYLSAIRNFGEAIKRNPSNAAYYRARGRARMAVGQRELARKDFARAREMALNYFKPGPSKKSSILRRLIPALGVDVQFRYRPRRYETGPDGSEGTYSMFDARLALNALWYLADPGGKFNVGLGLNLGIESLAQKHNMVDISGVLALLLRLGKSSLSAEVGVGGAFLISGNDFYAGVRKGGFFKYGIRYEYRATKWLGIGASFELQHSMANPGRDFCVVPGAGLSVNFQ
jgi:tetratricopeptide (TPR) repeat protein